MKHIRPLFVWMTLFIPFVSFAQDPPLNWGEIKKSDLGQTLFAEDTSASAVILYDYGTSEIDNDLNIAYRYHARIRILTPAGYRWGTHSVVVNEQDDGESIDDIEGMTYTLGPDGEIVEQEMNGDAIFVEKLNGEWKRYRFTLPALAPGCVVEFRYTIRSTRWSMMRGWAFQTDEPVLWSEYRILTPRQISYAIVASGFLRFDVQQTDEVMRNVFGSAAAYLGTTNAKFWQHRWVIRNAPAIRDEPFVTTTKDYMNRLSIQLSGYALRNGGVEKVLQDWPTLVNELATDRTFGERIDVTRAIRMVAEQQTSGIADPAEKTRALYDWVRKKIVCTSWGLGSEQNVDDVLETKKGTAADISMLFISLLHACNITADPVITSTRANGLIRKEYPMISQFNRVLVRVQSGTTTVVVDPTDESRPIELLPVSVLNREGLVIREGTNDWIPLTTDRRDLRRSMATLDIQSDGTSAGWLEGFYSDYAALEVRRLLADKDKKHVEIARGFFNLTEEEAILDSVNIIGTEQEKEPIRIKAYISNYSGIIRAGENIYVTPMAINRQKSNPLKLEKRAFPLDFSYPFDYSTATTFNLPEGYVVADTLRNRSFTASGEDVIFKRMLQVEGTRVQMSSQFEVQKSQFEPRTYKEIRELYGRVVNTHAEQFTIIPAPPPPVVTAPSTKPAQPPKRKEKGSAR